MLNASWHGLPARASLLQLFVPPATLIEFAHVNDAAAATTKKLQKQAILAEYFRRLEEDEDLRLAVRYASGRAFASTDERVLGASGAIVSDVVLDLLKLDGREYHELVVRSGEIGEAISKVWSRFTEQQSPAAPPRVPYFFARKTSTASLEVPTTPRTSCAA